MLLHRYAAIRLDGYTKRLSKSIKGHHFDTGNPPAPACQGPPGCEALCVRISRVRSQGSWIRSQEAWNPVFLLLLAPGDEQFTFHQQGSQDLGVPQNHPEKSSNFKPIPRATKIMKIGPKVTNNHEKSDLES